MQGNVDLQDQVKTKAELLEEIAALRAQVAQFQTFGDEINQMLFGVALYTDAATQRLACGDIDEAGRHLADLQSITQGLLLEMRAHLHCQ
ncbi:hypothetical protein GC175_03565 [bacterium]|nr:hypothetical protein [bacterium]